MTNPSTDLSLTPLQQGYFDSAVRFAYWMVQRHINSFRAVDAEDVKQASLIALAMAAKKYDPSRGVKFTSYAAKWLRGSIIDEVSSVKWKYPPNVSYIQEEGDEDSSPNQIPDPFDWNDLCLDRKSDVVARCAPYLTPRQVEIVTLLATTDMNKADVARHMGISRQAVHISCQNIASRLPKELLK